MPKGGETKVNKRAKEGRKRNDLKYEKRKVRELRESIKQ